MTKKAEQILQDVKEIQDSMVKMYKYEPVDVSHIEIPHISMLCFLICLDPSTDSYGHGIGSFVYDEEDVYQFHYNIHTPYSKGPHRSNQMTDVNMAVLEECHGITGVKMVETLFFQKAFWDHTPDSCLDEQDKVLRMLIKALQAYCRKENLCAKLRKTDKVYEKNQMEKRARFLMENTTYGVTRAGMTLATVTDMQNAMYGVMDEPDPLKDLTRNERKLAMNTGAGVLPEQKLIRNGVLPEQKGV